MVATSSSASLTPTALRAALEGCPEAFVATDTNLDVIEWNAAAEALTGFGRAEALGGPPPHLTPAQVEELAQALESGDDRPGAVVRRHGVGVVPRRHADGGVIHVIVTGRVPLVDEAGTVRGHGTFFRRARDGDPRAHERNVYSRALAEAVHVDDVIDAVRRAITDLMSATTAFLLTRRGDSWVGSLAIGAHQEDAENIEILGSEVLDRLVTVRHATTIDLQVAGQPTTAWAVPAGPVRAATVLALVGVEVDPDDEATAEVAEAIATEAWAALARVDAVRELEGKVEILEAIAGVARATALEYEQMVNHVARHAAQALSCERAAVYLWDEAHTELSLAAFHSTDREWAPGDPIHHDGRRAAAEMFATVEPFLTQDTRECPWLAGPWDHTEGAVSVYGMPLLVGDQDLGFLVVAHTNANPRGFTSLCTQVGGALSRQAALAISNAKLMVAQTQANRALLEANRRRADYVEGITHDLRTPVTAILGFARTLRRAGDTMRPDDHDEALATIERQSLRVTRMLDDMMDSARADAGELHPDRTVAVPLHHVVSEALLVAPPEHRSRLHASCDPTVITYGDADQLTRVVQNLVANALKYAPKDAVEVVVEQRDGMAQLLVIDHGPGIPSDVDVFARFSRGDSGGTGLGLYTVRAMVQAHGGSIEIRSTEGGGTTVDVRLPLFGGT